MRLVTLVPLATFAASTVDAASYQKTDGTIFAPIQRPSVGENHFYTGVNLEPGANRPNAYLTGATFTDAQDLATARGNSTPDE